MERESIVVVAANHYVLTGETHLLDGEGREYDSPSEDDEMPSNQVERWRQQVDAAADRPLSVIPSEALSPPDNTGQAQAPTQQHQHHHHQQEQRRRSTGQQSPSPATTLPPNSRIEISAPRDIGAWVLSIPQGAQPPDDVPWSSLVNESESCTGEAMEEHLIAHAERKPGPDISTVALSSETRPRTSIDVHQWRYENYVDWWRTGMAAEQGKHVSVHEVDGKSSKPSLSSLGKPIVKDEPAEKHLERDPPVLSVPPPPPVVVPSPPHSPSVQVVAQQSSPKLVRVSSPENLKRVYYRLMNRNEEPLPVRNVSRTNSMTADKSIGVLFLDNPASYRACDLMTIIHSRECSHINSPTSSRYSPALRRKFMAPQQQHKGRSRKNALRPQSPTTGSFALQQDLPKLQIKLKLYFDTNPRGANRRDTLSFAAKTRRLKDNDVLPYGVGVDEASALIVKVLADEVPVNGKGDSGAVDRQGTHMVQAAHKCGTFLAVVVRGVAAGIKSVGDGLVRFADCLSGTPTRPHN